MDPLISLARLIGAPGSTSFFAVCIVAAVAAGLWIRRLRRFAVRFVILVALLYAALAMPVVAHAIADRLPAVSAATDDDLRGIRILFVLDGDDRRGRAAEAMRVYRLANPPAVAMLGDPAMADALIDAGIPRQRLTSTTRTRTAPDQIGAIQNMLGDQRATKIALIASRLETPRIAALAKEGELAPAFVPSPLDVEPPRSGIRAFVPSLGGLRLSREAIAEHAALALGGR